MSVSSTIAPSSPYKGLAAFDDTELDALFFFGRAWETEVVAANVLASRLTVLYGPSGVGKSSLLRAGVVRTLRSDGGYQSPAVAVYGSWSGDPLAGVEEAARAAVTEALGREPAEAPGGLTDRLAAWSAELGAELCLLLDQLEELFLYHPASEGAGGFLELLPELVTRPGLRVNILLGIRDDALAQLDVLKARIPGLFANSLRLDQLDREAGRAAIVGPLDRYNSLVGPAARVEIEPELADAVLDEVAAGRIESGRVRRGAATNGGAARMIETPYLQLVMQRIWEVERDRGSSTLRSSTFWELGGAQRIVESHLEGALAALTTIQRDAAASVFGHLVTPSGTKIAHGVSDLASYAAMPEGELEPVLRTLAHERILRPLGENGHGAGSRYEIFHDVLGDAVLDWRMEHETAKALERERARARRRHRRTIVVAAVTLVALAAMTALAIYALAQRDDAQNQAAAAQRQREIAQIQARRARARALDATAAGLLDTDPERGLRLALAAANISATPQAEEVLRDALRSARLEAIFPAGGRITEAAMTEGDRAVFTASEDGVARIYDSRTHGLLSSFPHGAPVLAAAIDDRARIAVTGGEDGRAIVWSVRAGRRLRVLRHGARIRDVAVTPDGALVVSSGGRAAKLWRVSDGVLLGRLAHPTPVKRATFSPDGRLFVTISNDRFARIFDAGSGRPVYTLDQPGRMLTAWFASHENFVVTGGADRTARLWHLAPEALVGAFEGHRGSVTKAVMSPRGQFLATASTDGSGRIWDVRTKTVVTPLVGHSNSVEDVAFGPNGFSVVTASRDGTARVWKSDNGDEVALLAGHGQPVGSAVFTADGRKVLTAGDDGTARLWNAASQPLLRLVARTGGPITAASFSPDENHVLVTSGARARLVRLSDARKVRTFEDGAPVAKAALSPDGRHVALAGGDRVAVYDATTGRLERVQRFPATITAFVYSPDGESYVTGDSRGAARIWTSRGEPLHALLGHRLGITDVAFDADGGRVATASRDETARIWNARTGEYLRELSGHTDDVMSAAFSPDGRQLLTSSLDHDAILWSARTGVSEKRLVWHFGGIRDAAFSPDGRWIITAGPRSAQLWQPGSRAHLFRYGLGGHEAPLTSVSFDRTSRRVLTASGDGTVRIYACRLCGRLGDLRALARAHIASAGRGLTTEQRRKYLG
jgi:WD40 repeat protein